MHMAKNTPTFVVNKAAAAEVVRMLLGNVKKIICRIYSLAPW